MERDNKYYEIIENLIRNHKKFNGYDAIIDDIIDDVYKHSKTVIDTVKNEEVVFSYLQKVASVSIITVPKRMNFHSELKHRTILAENPVITESVRKQEVKPVVAVEKDTELPAVEEENAVEVSEIEPVQKANTEFVDKMINSIDTASITGSDVVEALPEADEELEENLVENIEVLEQDTIDDDLTLEEDIIEHDEVELDIDDPANEEEESVQEELIADNDDELVELSTDEAFEPDEDELLVENNSDELESEDSELIIEDDSDDENLLTDSGETESIETVELINDDEQDDSEQYDEIIQAEDGSDFEQVDLIVEEETAPLLQEDVAEPEVDGDSVLAENLEEEIPSDITNFEYDPTEIQELETADDIELVENDEDSFDSELNFGGEDIAIEFEDNDEDSEVINAEEKAIEFKPVDYSLFSYAPKSEGEQIDIQSLENKLFELNSQKPELNILKIFDLKYKQNLPIAKIAEELNIDNQDVVSALDEILELI